jgi:hypothetical protein
LTLPGAVREAEAEARFAAGAQTGIGDRLMKPVMWNDRVQVQISEKNPVSTNHVKIEAARVLWEGIDLADAVWRWTRLRAEDQPCVTIVGTETFAGEEIGELAKRSDFPHAD